jgi:hypothetical protein
MMTATFILKTQAHPTYGDAYVILTDHTEEAFLRPLQRLAEHRAGTILHVEDLANLYAHEGARDRLIAELRQAHPRFVAIAPRLQSYRENMLLGMWDVFASLGPDPQLAVFPGLLVAPNAQSFEALIEHSIHYQPQGQADLRPFVMGQVMDSSPGGQRSLQKVGILSNLFDQHGCATPSLVIRGFRARLPEGSQPSKKLQWDVSMAAPGQFVSELPPPAKRALDEASLLVMYGHGVPGMTCSLDVGAFHDVKMTNKLVLCGSCFSAYPPESDFPPMAGGPDGSRFRQDAERFLMRAIENGAVVTYGHMRENAGFPHMYPVLEAWMQGLTVGEAYQRQINAILAISGLAPQQLVLREGTSANATATQRRNQLLYAIVGDPALQPLERMVDAPAAASH